MRPILRRREPILVLLFSVFSFGLYLPYWLDFLFVIFTFAIYGIWVDYRISQQISDFEERNGLGPVQDTSVIAVILDVASYFTVFFTNFVTSAIQQDQLNGLADKLEDRVLTEAGVIA
jgi:ABC-type multidrug transport system fused ATPase/permease subunit